MRYPIVIRGPGKTKEVKTIPPHPLITRLRKFIDISLKFSTDRQKSLTSSAIVKSAYQDMRTASHIIFLTLPEYVISTSAKTELKTCFKTTT